MLKNGCITIDEYKATIENGEVTTVEKGICEQASSKRKFTVVSQEETGKLLPGDELAIDSEHFYVISSDENETVMLAKYNLLVGNTTVYNPSPKSTPIDESTEGYGLQSENALGDIGDSSKEYKGVLKYSSTFYWDQKIQENGSDYPYVYDLNSELYIHVENYRDELEKMGAHISEARLLKYQEAINILGDEYSGDSYQCNTYSEDKQFIFSTSYWLGTAFNTGNIHYIGICGKFSSYGATYPYGYGVRPVIVVNTSDIDL